MNRSACKQFAVRASLLLWQALRPGAHSDEEAERLAQCWFMRLTVLRYLEANGGLPSGMPRSGDALRAVCEALAGIPALAGMFGEDLPVPEILNAADSDFFALLSELPDSEWADFPEILGWLYQYRNTRLREQTFADLRSHIKIAPERIPAATQMFTPDWIVRYMTENALGALCTPADSWRYVIPEAQQPSRAAAVLQQLTAQRSGKSLEELTILDPCMGTGHILAYVFDALMALYRKDGYAPADAAVRILEKNLYGLDIDEHACHLAAFVLLMKAQRYAPDILTRGTRPHLYHFSGLAVSEDTLSPQDRSFAAQFEQAQMFGSLLQPTGMPSGTAVPQLDRMQTLCDVLNAKYDAVITNPPYMGSSSMNPQLSAFVRRHYPDSKADLFAAFMERCAALTAPHGCFAMITQHAWMFLSSYERLRSKLQAYTMRSMVHLGARAFSSLEVGTIVQTTAFVCMGSYVPDYRTTYLRLTEDAEKERAFFAENRRYVCDSSRFSGIPGSPLCYWISDRMRHALQPPKLAQRCTICQGMTTSDNKRFLRRWYEVPPGRIAFGCADAQEALASGSRWFPYNKGGKLRKWYGNHNYVVDFSDGGAEMRAFHAELNKTRSGGRIKNERMYFKPALTWPFITESTKFGVRFQPQGFLFDVSGSSLFPDAAESLYIMGFLSSKVALEMLRLFNPTMNFQVENIGSLPILFDAAHQGEVERLVSENIAIACADWDSSELSWDFSCHPLLQAGVSRLSEAFSHWEVQCRDRMLRMQQNEQRLNEIFLRIYGLEGEISPEVPMQEITLHHAEQQTDVRSFLSYAVGCFFGRYRAAAYVPLAENFLPLADGTSAVQQLEAFLRAVCGEAALAENLQFLADALGGGEPHAVLRRYFAVEFYADHCRTYRKRPIYWMADSGRRHACRGLLYLHRMDADSLSLIEAHAQRADARMLAEITAAQRDLVQTVRRTEAADLRRQLLKLEENRTELSAFRERLHALQRAGTVPDPDDGVLRNYEKLQGVLAKIR